MSLSTCVEAKLWEENKLSNCGNFLKHDLYEQYYKITGLWWVKFDNMFDCIREYIYKRCNGSTEKNLICIRNCFDRLMASDYVKITCDTHIYLKHSNTKTLRRLINDYLCVFDLINAFYYMDEYIKKRYWNYKRYVKMKRDLGAFIDWIRKSLKKREDILVFWIDCTSYKELEWFPKLKRRAEESYFFEHAYTPTPTTAPTMMAMNSKWLNIDDFSKYDKLRKTGCFDVHSSLLLQKLKKYGYEFGYFVSKAMSYPAYKEPLLHLNRKKYICSNRLCFDAINKLMMTDKKQFMIIHCLTETHYPYWYPDKNGLMLRDVQPLRPIDLVNKTGGMSRQVYNAARHLDEQIAFYSDLLGDGISKIYMSDHGKNCYYEEQYKRWTDRINHTFFFIQSRHVLVGKESRLFTLQNFLDLTEAILKAHESDGMANFERVFEKDYMKVQSTDVYSKNIIDIYKVNCCLESAHSYRGIRTLEDYYLRFRNRELYYRNGDEETNLIDAPKYAARIAELRELAGDYFLDIDRKEKFKYARLLYK